MVKREVLASEGSVMVVKVELDKDFHGDEDKHVEEQVSYIEKGSVEFEVAGEKRVLHEGDVQYIPSNAPHRVNVIESCTILDVFTPVRKDLLDGK
ncbi:cupin domain-containing protein [Alteribacter keqinensis]|uniref:Cupin domain-containing protein n=1 Tax=Alteribacter keqinensis TaxID=2483800 RepID=A0A3M7TSG9_9BACI|nr:cupin domain-containing protein [Alteribacter keqinensis]RNA67702.1 cupin domain-containing protein [Alteribacter keqinensis]